MQNNMVSIPTANMNGGLKAANSSGVGVGVSSSVLASAQRVYLAPGSRIVNTSNSSSSNLIATTAATVSGATTTNSNNPNGGTVRYFSQFSKQQLSASVGVVGGVGVGVGVGQRKLLNGDTMLVVNGSKPLIFATPINNNNNNNNNSIISSNNSFKLTAATTTATATTTVPNGNRLLINKQPLQLQQQQSLQTTTVIGNDEEFDHLVEVDEDEAAETPTALLDAAAEQHVKPMQEHAEALLTGANASSSITPTLKTTADTEAEPELDIVINNVVCSFSVRCHLKLRDIALNGSNVEYRRENGMVTMKLRRPYTTASIWSSGRITCTGATSEIQAKIAARRYARCLAKLGFPTHFQNFRIVNVLGTCSMPWAIKIVNFSERHRNNASYEPELHPGVTYKMREPKATLKIFSTGSITVTAASVNDVESAIQHIYPLVHEFRKQRSAEELQHLRAKQRHLHGGGGGGGDANANVNELENQAVEQAKLAGKDDIFVNSNAAAHSAAAKASDAPATLAATPLNNMRRLEQYKQFHQLQEQTLQQRRHIPFTGSADSKATTTAATTTTAAANSNSNSSSSCSTDNICANARRRATECWATKLQNKRPRYNDYTSTGNLHNNNNNNNNASSNNLSLASATTTQQQQQRTANVNVAATGANIINTTNISNKIHINNHQLLQPNAKLRQNVVVMRARNATTTTTTTAAGIGMGMGMGTATIVRAASSAAVGATVYKQQQQQQLVQTFSPADFQDVDDLIEEDVEDELEDMHF
ncbi:uncharacterized protein LOC108606110 [Drosophila busckii]|uniref:uncharacterized protein LOC108606110 n=1 Tax=Drosophila busckii TaxID=30019 RepID=UPI00083F48FB|nr:uncharacterized protein LOC108606110 [Drosophila busckii]XP_017851447.1 uncharacterized protein LOC108606110 [Drosophila busckii]XP_017851449.1 uncharacterized protein LOC108606110 [Drosophila busckii]XP_017851450.1 uncharacterized protein LOC108606110 [Drosophila busckii]XP_017851451.1 uncharacterized protein LOC108606110 [Drosophila busckii]XP_017851452.1 uncharacterized protein LOC108606110 [Drosophila busckii]